MEQKGKEEKKPVVEVEFNQQQDAYLERLRKEGRYGSSDAEIIQNIFQEFLNQTQA